MNARWILGASAVVAMLTGCDEGHDEQPGASRYRDGDVAVLATRQTTTSFTIKGCDPPFPWWRPGVDPAEAPEQWHMMIQTQAKRIADETLVAAFMSAPDIEEFCTRSCTELGGAWDGGAHLVGDVGEHAMGDVAITGECPNETLATEIETWSTGQVACNCASGR